MLHINPQDKDKAHSYELGVEKGGVISRVEVTANTRNQAAKIAKDAGYAVRDVNMVG